jgi:hypothetical protein
MWLRWVLAIAVAAAVIVAIVLTVQRAGPENSNEEAVEGETNRIADLAITEDEAPRTASLTARATPTAALARAIGEDVRRRISNGQLTGPLQSVSCTAGRPVAASGARVPYSCRVRSAGINYTFLAVVEAADRRLTWCKVDPSAVVKAGPEVLISPRCKA